MKSLQGNINLISSLNSFIINTELLYLFKADGSNCSSELVVISAQTQKTNSHFILFASQLKGERSQMSDADNTSGFIN